MEHVVKEVIAKLHHTEVLSGYFILLIAPRVAYKRCGQALDKCVPHWGPTKRSYLAGLEARLATFVGAVVSKAGAKRDNHLKLLVRPSPGCGRRKLLVARTRRARAKRSEHLPSEAASGA